ncbi:MAG: hypothetical protein Q8P84_01410 [Deltaproteobacteria bacterium]|nr:hypothetical protein [Deltaproteobacteria bacterium]
MFTTPSFVLHEVIVGSAASTAAALHALSSENLDAALPELSLITGALHQAGGTATATELDIVATRDNGHLEEFRQELERMITQSIAPEDWARLRAEALKRNAARFGHLSLTPHTVFPNEDLYPDATRFLAVLQSYTSAHDADSMTLLERKFAKVSAVYQKVERTMIDTFGPDRENWPKNLRQPLEELYNIGNNIAEKMGVAVDSFTEALREMEVSAPEGKVRAITIRGIFAIKAVFGQLTDAQEALVAKKGKAQDKPLLQRWRAQVERITELHKKETEGVFELTAGLLANLVEAAQKQIPIWREDALSLQRAAEELKGNVSEHEWSEDMERLYNLVRDEAAACLEACGRFTQFHEALLQENTLPAPDLQKLKGLYTETIHAKGKAGVTLGKTRRALLGHTGQSTETSEAKDPHNLSDLTLARHDTSHRSFSTPDRNFQYKGHTISVKEGKVQIDGVLVQLNLNTGTAGQDEKIRQIIDTLEISPDEERRSVQLAHPFYQKEVEQRLSRGKSLRKLIDVDDNFGVAKVFDYRFGTVFYIPYRTGWFSAEAKAIMPLFHGGGGARSRGETLLAPANKMRGDFKISTLVFDLPNHGGALADERFHDLPTMLSWMDTLFQYCRYLADYKIPLVAVGRSSGENLLDEYAARYPEALDGIIGVSGYQPGWLAANEAAFRRRIEEGNFQPHPTGLPMVLAYDGLEYRNGGFAANYCFRESQWTFAEEEAEEARRKTPKLMFTGTEDQDSKEGVPDFWQQRNAEALYLGHQSLVIKGGRHDLLALNLKSDPTPENRARVEKVYTAIGNFIKKIADQFETIGD